MLSIPIIFGVVLCVFGGQFVLKAQATKNWPTTAATITQVNLTETTSSTSTTTSKQKKVDISVLYRYQVNSKQYQSDKYSYGEGKTVKSRLKNKLAAQQWLEKSPYQTGNEISIYYNPNSPQQAVIRAGTNIWTFVPFIIGLLITMVFSVILWRVKK
jgi:hypothetical protein